jgi:hypothetical protein
MFERLKQEWQRFRRRKPGQRFEERYHLKQKSARSVFRKVLIMSAGGLTIAVGIVLLAFPGPGTVLLLIGAALIAEESLVTARALDWLELRLRGLYTRTVRAWRRTSPIIRVLLVICALAIAASLAFGAYKIALAI